MSRTNAWITFMDEEGRTLATIVHRTPEPALFALDLEDWLSHHPFTHPANNTYTDWPVDLMGELVTLFVRDFGDDNDLDFVAPDESIDHGEGVRIVVARYEGKRLAHMVVAAVKDLIAGNHKGISYSIISDGPADGTLAHYIEGRL